MSAFDLPQLFPFALAAAILFGLAFGSFLNVCIYRLPLGRSVVTPRSACPRCGHAIAAYDNVPVVSWLVLRGRCRACREPIAARYMFIELLIAALFAFCFLRFGYSLATLKFCVFVFLVLALIFTDLDHRLLPDSLTLSGLGIATGFSVFVPMPSLGFGWEPSAFFLRMPFDLAWRVQSLLESLAGAALGALLIYGAGWLYLKLRGVEGMGFGDVKLMAMVGGFLGMQLAVCTIGGAAVAASAFGLGAMLVVWMKRAQRHIAATHQPLAPALGRAWRSARLIYRHYEIPFGSFLGFMALVALFYGQALLGWYLRLWGLQ